MNVSAGRSLLTLLSHLLRGRLKQADGDTLGVSVQAGDSPPEGKRLLQVETQTLGHHCGPQREHRGAINLDRMSVSQ